MGRKQLEITGKKYNRLTAVKRTGTQGEKVMWLFRCDCGKEKILQKTAVTGGNTRSCGCMLSEHIKRVHATKVIHGFAKSMPNGTLKSRLYRIWANMKSRCNNPKNKYYGGRGISVAPEWKGFQRFLSDMGQSYEDHVKKFGTKNTSIDRIDVNGNYCKENCRWSTSKEQTANRTI